ncbi:MAG TPA: hypothetical protein VN653_03510 [Anaerolineales bacterium]|nr:hypothetical protein [Anaerolineales bacterium]
MLTELLIRDETTASLGKAEHTFTVHISGERISLRELIRLRVTQEVEDFNSRQPAVFRMLVQPNDTERTLNGYKFHKPRQVNPVTQYEKAIEAFEGNGFIVLVDDRQIESLDTEIAFRPETSITFLKLVPLVGG